MTERVSECFSSPDLQTESNHYLIKTPFLLLPVVNYTMTITILYTVGRVLDVWFNVLGKSGQIASLVIAKVEPVPRYGVCAHLCL